MNGSEREVPRAKGHPILGSMARLRKDPLGTLTEAATQGDIVDIGARHKRVYQIGTPELVKEVLQGGWRNFPKGRFSLRPLLGEGLVTSEGPPWQARRRLLQPVFMTERLDAMVLSMAHEIDSMLDGWSAKSSGPIDIAEEMNQLSLRIALRGLFGTALARDEEHEVMGAVHDALSWLNDRLWATIRPPVWMPLPAERRFRRARAVIDEVVYRLIRSRRKDGGSERDLLGLMLAARDGTRAATDVELRDEAVTMLVAGHETSAAGLAWTWYLLGKFPEFQEKARDESVDLGRESQPTSSAIQNLKWARAVASESMRLYPPIWFFTRVANGNHVLGNYAIPAGTVTIVSSYVLHRRPDVWPEPTRFLPDRFLGKKVSEYPKGSYIPFGSGPHMCIGAAFAMLETQLVISKVNARYRLLPTDPAHVPTALPLISLRPAGRLMMNVTPW